MCQVEHYLEQFFFISKPPNFLDFATLQYTRSLSTIKNFICLSSVLCTQNWKYKCTLCIFFSKQKGGYTFKFKAHLLPVKHSKCRWPEAVVCIHVWSTSSLYVYYLVCDIILQGDKVMWTDEPLWPCDVNIMLLISSSSHSILGDLEHNLQWWRLWWWGEINYKDGLRSHLTR